MAAVLETGHSRADFLIDLMTGDGRQETLGTRPALQSGGKKRARTPQPLPWVKVRTEPF
jgi:hypothetical protein